MNRFATHFEIFLFGGYFVKVYKVFAVGAYSLGENAPVQLKTGDSPVSLSHFLLLLQSRPPTFNQNLFLPIHSLGFKIPSNQVDTLNAA